MNRTLLNKCTTFGAKIFGSYWVITFLMLGHFLKPHSVLASFRRRCWQTVRAAVTRLPLRQLGFLVSYVVDGVCAWWCIGQWMEWARPLWPRHDKTVAVKSLPPLQSQRQTITCRLTDFTNRIQATTDCGIMAVAYSEGAPIATAQWVMGHVTDPLNLL